VASPLAQVETAFEVKSYASGLVAARLEASRLCEGVSFTWICCAMARPNSFCSARIPPTSRS
jgi:hypothetical protein